MKVSERMLSSPQKVAQMQHYWDNLWHMTPDKDKKKNLERRFGIKNIKVDKRGKILSFEEIEKKVRSFEQFLEAKQKTAVFSFGRLNPPTTGHQKLLQKIIQTSKQMAGYACLYVSHSQDPKRNPLSAKQKVASKIVKNMGDKGRYDETNQLKTLVVMQVLGNTKTFFDAQKTLQDTENFFDLTTVPDGVISDSNYAQYILFGGSDAAHSALVDSQY